MGMTIDCISRAEALKLMQDNWRTHNGDWAMQESMDDIRALPSVTPQEPKTGHWIPTEYDSYADGNPVWDKWECSECGCEHNGEEDTLTAYCPDCGAKMVEPQESEDNNGSNNN